MDIVESIFWTGFTIACTITVIVTCGLATMIMDFKLIQLLHDLLEDPGKELEAEPAVATAMMALGLVVVRVIATLATQDDLTPWIFNGVVARSCAEVCVALGLLKFALAALQILLRQAQLTQVTGLD